MRTFVEQVQEQGRLDLIDDFVRPDFRDRTAAPGQPADRSGLTAVTMAVHAAFSDLRVEIVHCVADGDLVATHKVFRGRHTGEWFGLAPSGNTVDLRIIDMVRFQDGQWAEHWSVADITALLHPATAG